MTTKPKYVPPEPPTVDEVRRELLELSWYAEYLAADRDAWMGFDVRARRDRDVAEQRLTASREVCRKYRRIAAERGRRLATLRPRPSMSNAELCALAALVQSQSVLRASEDAFRIANGLSPAYGGQPPEAMALLEAELVRRGVL